MFGSGDTTVTTVGNDIIVHTTIPADANTYTTGVTVTGTTTKCLTLTLNNGSTVSTSFTDLDTDTITRLRGGTSGTYCSGDITICGGGDVTVGQSTSNITLTYSHPTGGVMQPSTPLTNACVISQIGVNSLGHVTGHTSRNLTAGDLGALTAVNLGPATATTYFEITNSAGTNACISGATSTYAGLVTTGNQLWAGTKCFPTFSGGTVCGATLVCGGTVRGTTICGTTISGTTVCGNTISGGTISGVSTISTCLRVTSGATTGYVLTSDASGNATWQAVPENDAVKKEITQASHGFSVGDVVGYSGTTYNKAIADGNYDGEILGIVSKVVSTSIFELTQSGYVTGLTSLSQGSTYFLSPTTAGAITATEPTTNGQVSKAVLLANSTTTGWVLPYPGYLVSTGQTGALTGVTNLGDGIGVYDSTSANVARFRSILGSGDTTVTLSGGTIIVYTDAPDGSLSGLSDTTISSPIGGDLLYYSGDTWVNYTPDAFLNNICTSAPLCAGQILVYDSLNGYWCNTNGENCFIIHGSIEETGTTINGTGALSGTGTITYITSVGGTNPTTITISHLDTAGYKHIPSGGSTGQILCYGGSSGTATWGDAPSTVVNLGVTTAATTNTITNDSGGSNAILSGATSTAAGLVTNANQTWAGIKCTSTFCGTTSLLSPLVSGTTVCGVNASGFTNVIGTNICGTTLVSGVTTCGTNIRGGNISGTTISGATHIRSADISGGTVCGNTAVCSATLVCGGTIRGTTICGGTVSATTLTALTSMCSSSISGTTISGGTVCGATLRGATTCVGTIQISGGTPGAGKFLCSDASGNATWSDAPSAVVNLGSATATTYFEITNSAGTNACISGATNTYAGLVTTGNQLWDGIKCADAFSATTICGATTYGTTAVCGGIVRGTSLSGSTVSASTCIVAGTCLSASTRIATACGIFSSCATAPTISATTAFASSCVFSPLITGTTTCGISLIGNTLRVITGAATGCVLTSDATGNATWQSPVEGVTTFTGLTDTPSNYVNTNYLRSTTNSIEYRTPAQVLSDISALCSTIFNTYTGNTQPILDGAVTGATNIGTGSQIYSSTSNRVLQLRTLVGSGDTTVSTVGNDIRIYTNIPATTYGTLNTTCTTALSINASESFGSNICLHRVSKTGCYDHLSGTPTIPTVNNCTICISGGTGLTTGGNFTLNQNTNKTISIVHAAYTARNVSATGANIVSCLISDCLGHVTSATTRTLTASDIGAQPAGTYDNYSGWSFCARGVAGTASIGACGTAIISGGTNITVARSLNCIGINHETFTLNSSNPAPTGLTYGSTFTIPIIRMNVLNGCNGHVTCYDNCGYTLPAAPNLSVSATTTTMTVINSAGDNAVLTGASNTLAGLVTTGNQLWDGIKCADAFSATTIYGGTAVCGGIIRGTSLSGSTVSASTCIVAGTCLSASTRIATACGIFSSRVTAPAVSATTLTALTSMCSSSISGTTISGGTIIAATCFSTVGEVKLAALNFYAPEGQNRTIGFSSSVGGIGGSLTISGQGGYINGNVILQSGGVPKISTSSGGAIIHGTIRITGGTPSAGKVLCATDSDGNAAWGDAGGVNDGQLSISGGTLISGGGIFTANQSGGTSVTLNHNNVSRTNTTTAQTATHGGTFTAVDVISSSSQGHITGVRTKTVTLPAADNYSCWLFCAAGCAGTHSVTSGGAAIISGGTNITLTRSTNTIGINHSTYTAINFNTTTSTVLACFATDTTGHVTSATTRTLSASDIGALSAVNLGVTTATTTVTITNSAGTNAVISAATNSRAGAMSATDKTKLNGIASNADNYGGWWLTDSTFGTGYCVTGGSDVRFLGDGSISVKRENNCITISGSSGAGTVDLGVTTATTAVTITNSAGTNAVLSGATASMAGLVTTGTQTWNGVKYTNSCFCAPTICGSITIRGATLCATTRFTTSTSGVKFCGATTGCGVAGDWVATSDCRVKTNIYPISNALSTVIQLCGVNYNLCDDESNQNNVGLIAQDVEKVLPEIVSKNEPSEDDLKYGITDQKLGLKYDKLTAVLVEAIKEQQKQIEELKNKVELLEKGI